MNYEGKTCGMCDKGKLYKIQDKVGEGVYVDAFKCRHCGEISYSEKVMKQVEALHKQISVERKIVKVGSSIAVPIPSAIAKKMRLKAKESVFVREEGSEIIVRPSPA